MSRSHIFNSDFWNDPWVVDTLNPLDAHLYIYLFTNSHCNVSGVYQISLRTIAFEVKIDQEELVRMIGRMAPKVRYINGWVVLSNTVKNQNYRSPKMKTAIDTWLNKVPPELIQYINWPTDYGKPKPKGSNQTSLLDHEQSDQNIRYGYGMDTVSTDSNPVFSSPSQSVDELTSETGVGYGMDTVSHNNYNNNYNEKPTDVGLAAPAAQDTKPIKTASREIDEMLEYWKLTVGYPITSKMRYNRYAISNMLKVHKMDGLKRLVNGVAQAKQDKFAPRIADFRELQSKINELLSWGHGKHTVKDQQSKHGGTVIS